MRAKHTLASDARARLRIEERRTQPEFCGARCDRANRGAPYGCEPGSLPTDRPSDASMPCSIAVRNNSTVAQSLSSIRTRLGTSPPAQIASGRCGKRADLFGDLLQLQYRQWLASRSAISSGTVDSSVASSAASSAHSTEVPGTLVALAAASSWSLGLPEDCLRLMHARNSEWPAASSPSWFYHDGPRAPGLGRNRAGRPVCTERGELHVQPPHGPAFWYAA